MARLFVSDAGEEKREERKGDNRVLKQIPGCLVHYEYNCWAGAFGMGRGGGGLPKRGVGPAGHKIDSSL